MVEARSSLGVEDRAQRRRETSRAHQRRPLAGGDAKVGLAGDASISEVIAPLQQHLASDAETGVLAVKAACTLAIRCSSAARKQVLAPSLAKAVLQATQVFLTKDETKRSGMPRCARGRGRRSPAFSAADAGQLLGLVGAAANAAQFEPETRSRALEVALALAEAAPAVARRHASDVVTNVIPVAVGLSRTPEDIYAGRVGGAALSFASLSRLRRRGRTC